MESSWRDLHIYMLSHRSDLNISANKIWSKIHPFNHQIRLLTFWMNKLQKIILQTMSKIDIFRIDFNEKNPKFRETSQTLYF